MGKPLTPEQSIKSLWTRLKTVAFQQNTTIEGLARLTDQEIGRIPNLGVKSIALLLARYPHPEEPFPEPNAWPKLQPVEAKPPHATQAQVAEVTRLLVNLQAKLEARLEVIDALRALVHRLDLIADQLSPASLIHGRAYDEGPTLVEPLERARKALKEAGG